MKYFSVAVAALAACATFASASDNVMVEENPEGFNGFAEQVDQGPDKPRPIYDPRPEFVYTMRALHVYRNLDPIYYPHIANSAFFTRTNPVKENMCTTHDRTIPPTYAKLAIMLTEVPEQNRYNPHIGFAATLDGRSVKAEEYELPFDRLSMRCGCRVRFEFDEENPNSSRLKVLYENVNTISADPADRSIHYPMQDEDHPLFEESKKLKYHSFGGTETDDVDKDFNCIKNLFCYFDTVYADNSEFLDSIRFIDSLFFLDYKDVTENKEGTGKREFKELPYEFNAETLQEHLNSDRLSEKEIKAILKKHEKELNDIEKVSLAQKFYIHDFMAPEHTKYANPNVPMAGMGNGDGDGDDDEEDIEEGGKKKKTKKTAAEKEAANKRKQEEKEAKKAKKEAEKQEKAAAKKEKKANKESSAKGKKADKAPKKKRKDESSEADFEEFKEDVDEDDYRVYKKKKGDGSATKGANLDGRKGSDNGSDEEFA